MREILAALDLEGYYHLISTSLLYHTWGIRKCTYGCAHYEWGDAIFRVRQMEYRLGEHDQIPDIPPFALLYSMNIGRVPTRTALESAAQSFRP